MACRSCGTSACSCVIVGSGAIQVTGSGTQANPYTITNQAGETITTLVDNGDGTFTYTNENGDPVTFAAGETITAITVNPDGTFTYTSEDGTATTWRGGTALNDFDGTALVDGDNVLRGVEYPNGTLYPSDGNGFQIVPSGSRMSRTRFADITVPDGAGQATLSTVTSSITNDTNGPANVAVIAKFSHGANTVGSGETGVGWQNVTLTGAGTIDDGFGAGFNQSMRTSDNGGGLTVMDSGDTAICGVTTIAAGATATFSGQLRRELQFGTIGATFIEGIEVLMILVHD